MSRRSCQTGFTLLELIAVIIAIAIVAALFLPAVRTSREAAYRNQCQGKIKQIGLALLNNESAYSRFPLITSLQESQLFAAQTAAPGSTAAGPNQAGWSWIVRILPYLEEKNLYQTITQESNGFTIDGGPFTPSLYNGNNHSQHSSCVNLPALICPSWRGNLNTNGNATIDITSSNPPTGAPEYASVDSSAPRVGQQSYKGKVAPTNYKAVVGTHITRQNGNLAPLENGIMRLTAPQGTLMSEITDGTSKTLLVAETKECGYASWYDGTLNWLVTNNPNAALPPGKAGSPDQSPWANAQIGINVGYDPTISNSVPWLKSGMVSNRTIGNVNWGPSSDHSNGAVMNVFGDAHVISITNACDPAVYLNLTTINGGEAIDSSLIQ